MLKHVDDLKNLVKKSKKYNLVVVFAHDEYVIDAVAKAVNFGVINPILIGDQPVIEDLCHQYNIEATVIHNTDVIEAPKLAMNLVNQGKADIIMKGLIDTKYLLKAVVSNEYGIKAKSLLSHIGLVSVPGMNRVLFATDGAMMIEPTVLEKIGLVENAADLLKSLGYDEPKIGIVSSVEKVNPKIKSTMDAKEIVDYFNDKQVSFLIDGPFAIDNLVSIESVKHKNIESPVAGLADVLVFPNLDGGNIFYKTAVFLAKGDSAGIVMGAKVPIIVTSRADTMNAKLNSILLAVVNLDGILASRH